MRRCPALSQLTLLLTTALLAPHPTLANPHPAASLQAGFDFNELFARYVCTGQACGYSSQLCCTAGSTCYTDSNTQAQCGATVGAQAGGYWQVYTTTYTTANLATITSVVSSYVATVVAATATATAVCNYALNEQSCGGICCASGQYCYAINSCLAAANSGSSGYYSTYTTPITTTAGATAGAPILPITSSTVVITTTASPTTTVPFQTPIATGANITLTTSEQSTSTGLSGGAIAGIVIGVLVGLFLLALLCFYCCIKGLLDGVLALFGLGKRRRRRTTEVEEEYVRRSHHSGSANNNRRTWYGASRPARVTRYEEKDSGGRNLLGLGAGLAALWAVLGLKRQRARRREESKYGGAVSEYSYSSEYYTSASK